MPGVIIVLGSGSDIEYAAGIEKVLDKLGVANRTRVASAHKTPEKALEIIKEGSEEGVVFITVAGRSNALSGFTASNTLCPVIASPPVSSKFAGMDIFSSLSMPGGVCPMTVVGAEQSALAAAKILGLKDEAVSERIAEYMEANRQEVEKADREVRDGKR